MAELKVVVVGAGIGGLTAAIALRHVGIAATVYERASELNGLGAGVAIAPNGTRVLSELGLAEQLSAVAGTVSRYAYRGRDGDLIDDGGARLVPHDTNRTWSLHRGEFQTVLSEALPAEAVQFGRRCTGAVDTADGVRVTFADGTTADADLCIGADGIHSVLQGVVGQPTSPVSEGIMAYRGVIPRERVDHVADMCAVEMWLGPGQSFLTYPVSAGKLLNVVAFVQSDLDATESWTAKGEVAELAAAYEGWDARIAGIVAGIDSTFRWGIYDREPLERWSTEHVTLLGDSAHAVVPHIGQGANQAIEDAMTLAVLLEDAEGKNIPQRLALYEQLRRDRTRQVRACAREAGLTYRSRELTPRQQVDRLSAIFASLDLNTHDAGVIAREALKDYAN